MERKTELGLVFHAQVQTLEGRRIEFQPNHLLCDECWRSADSAYVMACLYGEAFASERDADKPDEGHGTYARKLTD